MFLFHALFCGPTPMPLPPQHWHQRGGHPEEPQWPVAHPCFQPRPQPPVLPALAGAQPQSPDGLVISERGLRAEQAALQLRTVGPTCQPSCLPPFCLTVSLATGLPVRVPVRYTGRSARSRESCVSLGKARIAFPCQDGGLLACKSVPIDLL